jgi:hypothetical protein
MRLTYGLGRKFNLEFFVRKLLMYFAKRSKIPFIIPYLIHQLLRWYAFLVIDCSLSDRKSKK